MSSSDDSETAEWEREQMLRGTQSRARHQRQNPTKANLTQEPNVKLTQGIKQNPDVIDATLAKRYVRYEIERAENEIETKKRSIGSTRLDIVRSNKRIEAMVKSIEKLEASDPFFQELLKLSDPVEVLTYLEKHKQLISKLPYDQKEMIDLLEGRMKETQVPTVVDVDD